MPTPYEVMLRAWVLRDVCSMSLGHQIFATYLADSILSPTLEGTTTQFLDALADIFPTPLLAVANRMVVEPGWRPGGAPRIAGAEIDGADAPLVGDVLLRARPYIQKALGDAEADHDERDELDTWESVNEADALLADIDKLLSHDLPRVPPTDDAGET